MSEISIPMNPVHRVIPHLTREFGGSKHNDRRKGRGKRYWRERIDLSTPMMTTNHPNLPPSELGAGIDAEAIGRDPSLVLEVLGQGVCVCSADGSIIWGNRVFRSFLPGVQRRVAVACRRVATQAEAGDPHDPLRWRRRQVRIALRKSNRFFDVVVAPLVGDDQSAQTARYVASVVEVTTQETMRRKINAINAAGRELLHIEPEAIKQLQVTERLAMLEKKVAKAAHDVLNFDHFAVRLLDFESLKLDLVMAAGLPAKAIGMNLFARAEGQGISGYVASTGKAYICPDTTRDPLYVYGLEAAGSSLTVPLRLFDRVVGVFNIENDKPNSFIESDRQFAEIFGHYIAMTLHVLNLLVVERYTTRQIATGSVQGELSAPLNDLIAEAEALQDEVDDPQIAEHIKNILRDADSIRRRVRNVAQGPQTLLGAEEALADEEIDPVLQGKRALVVDNEPVIRDTIRDVLTKRGCVVTMCSDGASAVKLLEQWRISHDAEEGFDLVISDINLGDQTGFEIFAAAKEAKSDLPVILMTGFGYDPHHSIVRASQEGLHCVLFKPFQVEKLIEEARGAVSNK